MESTGISTRVGIAGAVGIALFLAMLVGLRALRQDAHRSHATVQGPRTPNGDPLRARRPAALRQ